MHHPTPGPAHEQLAQFHGEWKGKEILYPSPWSPQEEEREGLITTRPLEGWFAVSDYTQRSGSEVTFRGHGVYSYDPATEEYVMYWFDSMGGAGCVARGTFEGNQLSFRNTSPMGQHLYRYTFNEGEMVFEMADFAGWRHTGSTLHEGHTTTPPAIASARQTVSRIQAVERLSATSFQRFPEWALIHFELAAFGCSR